MQRFKENDGLMYKQELSNGYELLVFTTKAQVYKTKLNDFEDCKASALGTYLPAALSFEQDERVSAVVPLKEYKGNLVLFFENGKAVRIPVNSYQTKQNRKKLTNAFFGGSPLVGAYLEDLYPEFFLQTDDRRALLVKGKQVSEKTTRTSYGTSVFTLKKGKKVISAVPYDPATVVIDRPQRYRKTSLPSTGGFVD